MLPKFNVLFALLFSIRIPYRLLHRLRTGTLTHQVNDEQLIIFQSIDESYLYESKHFDLLIFSSSLY